MTEWTGATFHTQIQLQATLASSGNTVVVLKISTAVITIPAYNQLEMRLSVIISTNAICTTKWEDTWVQPNLASALKADDLSY